MTSPSTATAVTALAPETLRSWIAEHQDLVVIDVRSAAEFESMHIRGSYNVPLPLLSEHTDELAARLGSRVVLVCQSGARAEQARQRLAGSGIDTRLRPDRRRARLRCRRRRRRQGQGPLGPGAPGPPRRRVPGGPGPGRR